MNRDKATKLFVEIENRGRLMKAYYQCRECLAEVKLIDLFCRMCGREFFSEVTHDLRRT